ncbi:MAG TPA: hypothetical protein VGI88_15395 [Verrucomicrobiae bacterium]|jgi:hypothetical protein
MPSKAEMNPEEMQRFWKNYSPTKRAKVEADQTYQMAIRNKDFIKAQERAVAIIHGNFQHRVHPLLRDFGQDKD